jgi:hypothetical protein
LSRKEEKIGKTRAKPGAVGNPYYSWDLPHNLFQNSRSKNEKETPKNETKRNENESHFCPIFVPKTALRHGLKIMRQV